MVERYDFLFSKSFALSAKKPPFIRLYTLQGKFFPAIFFFFQFNQRYKLLAIQIESPNCNTSRVNSRETAIKFPRKRKPCCFNLHSSQTFHRRGHFHACWGEYLYLINGRYSPKVCFSFNNFHRKIDITGSPRGDDTRACKPFYIFVIYPCILKKGQTILTVVKSMSKKLYASNSQAKKRDSF